MEEEGNYFEVVALVDESWCMIKNIPNHDVILPTSPDDLERNGRAPLRHAMSISRQSAYRDGEDKKVSRST